MKIIKLLFLLFLVFAIDATGAVAEQKEMVANKAEQPLQVKLPDGLYLFQPKLHESRFCPLFIIKSGKLIDPYPLAKKIGIPKFMKKYVTGKTFNVYVGTEMIGKLSNLRLDFDGYYRSKEMYPDIQGSGKYDGKPLPGRNVDNSLYIVSDYFLDGSTVKAIATPESFKVSKKMGTFTITEEDRSKIIESIQKHFISEIMEHKNEFLKRMGGQIIGDKGSRLVFAKALDIDGNGMKDFIGYYELRMSYKTRENKVSLSYHSFHFVLRDSGEIKSISLPTNLTSVGGILDVNQDGIQEIIFQLSATINVEDSFDEEDRGSYVEVFQYSLTGWTRIFDSVAIARIIE